MFTRVEIDGFKSFDGFVLDLEPFCVIAGPNAAGKSNFFDALRLLARLAETDVRSALQELRGEPHELFRQETDGSTAKRMQFAVEVLLDRGFTDPYGERHLLRNTRIRYEVGIERRVDAVGGLEKLYVFHEQATLIQRDKDSLLKRYGKTSESSIKEWAPAGKSKLKLISVAEDAKSIEVSQDGSGGRRRVLPLGEATETFLSSLRSGGDFQHLYALRKELISLRFLQLDPAAERLPSDVLARDELDPDGANLATVLARLQAETATEDQPLGVIADIRDYLSLLVPGVMDLEVVRNDVARQFQLFVTMRDGSRFSSRVLSDGTLRIIALLAVLHDPRRRGVLCFEEPENGIHEARLPGLIEFLRSASTDLHVPPQDENEVLTQIIVNTHSPLVLSKLHSWEIIGADVVNIVSGNSTIRKTRMRRGTDDELPLGDRSDRMTRYETQQLLQQREPEEAS